MEGGLKAANAPGCVLMGAAASAAYPRAAQLL